MTNLQHIVKEEHVGTRLDKLLTDLNEDYSRQQIQTWIKKNDVTVNGEYVKANYKCKLNDEIEWEIPSENEQTFVIHPELIPLDILYEDDYLLVLNKPKGMLVHPTQAVQSNTLVNGLKNYTGQLSNSSGDHRPGIVHRLDKDTSGLLVVAKDNHTHDQLQVQFQAQTVTRIYEAIVEGVVLHQSGIIQAPIGRNPKNRLQMAVVTEGKDAETHFQVLKRFSNHTHIACTLKTGRTHQIRVHLKYMKHPIVGDEVYGKISDYIQGQALHAKQLSFVHPQLKQKMTFTAEPPEEFEKLLQLFQSKS